MRWHRTGFGRHWRWKSALLEADRRSPRSCSALTRQMRAENPLWGAPHIHGELLKLGLRPAFQPSGQLWKWHDRLVPSRFVSSPTHRISLQQLVVISSFTAIWLKPAGGGPFCAGLDARTQDPRNGCGGRPRTRGDSAARKDRHQNLCVVKGASPRDCSGIISTASRVRAIRFSICGTAQIRLLRPDRSNHGNSSKVISSQVATFPPDRELRLRCEQEGYDKPLTRRHPAPRSHLVGHD